MKKTSFIYIGIFLPLLFSCRKYVEVTQYKDRTLTYTSDYAYLLNNVDVFSISTNNLPLLSSDDIDVTGAPNIATGLAQTTDAARAYMWATQFYDATQSDVTWDKLYNAVYTCNVITDGVLSSANGSDADKRALYAEARVQRAFCFLTLVSLYAPVYQSGSAASDMGIPIPLTENLFGDFSRHSVQQSFSQVIRDVEESVGALPATPVNTLHPGKAAAYAILARAYLQMNSYDSAGFYAQKALSLQSTLLNLEQYASNPSGLPMELKDPEVILHKTFSTYFKYYPLSTDLLNTFDSVNDYRYTLFLRPGSSVYPSFNGMTYYRYMYTGEFYTMENGPSVPEMMCIAAECLARQSQLNASLTLLNTLRQSRYNTSGYAPLTIGDRDSLIVAAVNEKRKEQMGRGVRWLDQKRLQHDPLFAKTYARTFAGSTYMLAPGSTQYAYPIPAKVIANSNGQIIQNKY